jgi:hypothetical protein
MRLASGQLFIQTRVLVQTPILKKYEFPGKEREGGRHGEHYSWTDCGSRPVLYHKKNDQDF